MKKNKKIKLLEDKIDTLNNTISDRDNSIITDKEVMELILIDLMILEDKIEDLEGLEELNQLKAVILNKKTLITKKENNKRGCSIMIDLYTELPKEDQDTEYDMIITYGDSIINTFCEDNYIYAINEMYKEHFTPKMLNDYIKEEVKKYSLERETYRYNKFDIDFFIELTTDLEKIKSFN